MMTNVIQNNEWMNGFSCNKKKIFFLIHRIFWLSGITDIKKTHKLRERKNNKNSAIHLIIIQSHLLCGSFAFFSVFFFCFATIILRGFFYLFIPFFIQFDWLYPSGVYFVWFIHLFIHFNKIWWFVFVLLMVVVMVAVAVVVLMVMGAPFFRCGVHNNNLNISFVYMPICQFSNSKILVFVFLFCFSPFWNISINFFFCKSAENHWI